MKTLQLFIVIIASLLSGCNWAKEKTKESIHKAGEVAGKTGSEFADGLKEGVVESFSNVVELNDSLHKAGLRLGKIIIKGTDSTSDNLVSAYIIFEKGFKGKLVAKAYDENGIEFGRSAVTVTAEPEEAKYYDFIFDARTNIDRKDKIVIQ